MSNTPFIEENTELVQVVQLPIIVQQFQLISEKLKEEADYILSLECNEETYKEVKKFKASFNKQYEALESKRKEVKKQILAPYDEFEKMFNLYIKQVFDPVKTEVSQKVTEVENGLKTTKRLNVLEYFDEYVKAKNVEFLDFADMDLNINLTVKETALKKEIKEKVDRIASEIEAIANLENSTEVLVEYKKCLNMAQAVFIVTERKKAIEEESQRLQAQQAQDEIHVQTVAKVDDAIEEFKAPTVEPEQSTPPTKYVTCFKVTGTLEQLQALKKFLKEGDYVYEQLNS